MTLFAWWGLSFFEGVDFIFFVGRERRVGLVGLGCAEELFLCICIRVQRGGKERGMEKISRILHIIQCFDHPIFF